MKEIKLNWEMDPSERLSEEIKVEENLSAKIVGKQLLEDFKSDKNLEEKYKSSKSSLKGIWGKIVERARKEAKSNCACVKDDDVFSWARQVILEGKLKNPEVKKTEDLTFKVKTKEDLIKEAEEDFKRKEISRLEDQKRKEEKKLKEKLEKKKQKEKEKIDKTIEEGQIQLW